MSDFTTHFVTANIFLEKHNFSEQFKTAFYYGVQGPDLFFYRTPLSPSEGMRFGGTIHDKVPKELFEIDSQNISTMNDYYKGYYFGVMLHYFGDRMMHQYIGSLTKVDKRRFAHIMFERDIDVFTYEDHFKQAISNFKVKNYYKYSEELNKEITDFWKKRAVHEYVDYEEIKQCMKKIVSYAVLFSKPRKALVSIIKAFEGNGNNHGIFSGHIKHTRNKEVMNYERNPWQCPTGEVNLSVWDFLNISISDFEKEYDKILTLEKENKPYSFEYNQTFSYGCDHE